MKQLFKDIYFSNPKAFLVWNHLWITSDDSNTVEFSQSEICTILNIPNSSLNRILKDYPEKWNNNKTFVEYEKLTYNSFKVSFYPRGKKQSSAKINTIYDDLFDWLCDYYEKIEFEYNEIKSHKKYIKTICGKIEKTMKDKNAKITDESLSKAFQFYFENLDDWWVKSGNITLPSINKHYTKILNQIKSKSNGTSKKDSYSKAAESVGDIDFGRIANKQ